METEIIDKLFLELSQVAQAKTAREIELETALNDANGMCRSAMAIATRGGNATNWEAFRDRLRESLDRQHQVIMPKGKDDGFDGDGSLDGARISSVCREQRRALEAVWDCWTRGGSLTLAEMLVRALVCPPPEKRVFAGENDQEKPQRTAD